MPTEAERAWMERSDDIFDVVADIDPPSRRIRYAFEAGYHAAGTEPDDVEHVCANHPLHAQAKIIGQRQEIGRLRAAMAQALDDLGCGKDLSAIGVLSETLASA